MEFLSEKQARNYLLFLAVICILSLCFPLLLSWFHLTEANRLLIQKEQTIISYLLDQNVSEEVLASSLSHTAVTKESLQFLAQIHHTEDTFPWLLTNCSDRQVLFFFLLSFTLLFLFSLTLLGRSFLFLRNRERTYQQALDIVSQFSEGDFRPRLPAGQQGTLYQLFSKIDQLATALKAKGENEQKSREFLKDMLSDISHQLKTPMAALSMYLEIISSEPENTDTVVNFSQKSLQSLGRMESLIQSLLKMSRMDAGSIHFDIRPCSVLELIHTSLSELQIRAIKEKKEIILPSQDAEILCDPKWTCEALGNLIKNALDHTDPGGNIHISYQISPLMLRLSVSDNGEGILPEDIHHIFKRFYRSKSSHDMQGVGLGLPLARAIVTGQGGSISVQSIPGKGSTFTISFLTKS